MKDSGLLLCLWPTGSKNSPRLCIESSGFPHIVYSHRITRKLLHIMLLKQQNIRLPFFKKRGWGIQNDVMGPRHVLKEPGNVEDNQSLV